MSRSSRSGRPPVWAAPKCSISFSVRSAADLGDAVLDGEVFVGAPRQPVLDIAQHQRDRGAHIAVKKIAYRHRVDDDLAGRIFGRPLLGGPAGHQRGALHEVVEFVVVAGDDALGENDERTFGFGRQLHRDFQGFAIRAFAVKAEHAEPREQKGLNRVLHEEMPARDDVEGAADGKREVAEDHGIGRAAVVRREHDAVARGEGGAEPLHAMAFDAHDAVAFAEIEGQQRTEEVPPPFAAMRGDEAGGFRDDDVLHRSAEAGRGRSCVKRAAAPASWRGNCGGVPRRRRLGRGSAARRWFRRRRFRREWYGGWRRAGVSFRGWRRASWRRPP